MQKKKGGTSVKGYEETKKSGTNEPELGIKHEKKKQQHQRELAFPPQLLSSRLSCFPLSTRSRL